jgi:Skp family chaperone for outer membrane proteins
MKPISHLFGAQITVVVFLIFFLPPLQMASASVGFVNTERVLKGSKAGNDMESANRAIRAIAEAEMIYFVFQEAVYASPRIDITERVLSRVKGSSVRSSAFPNSVQMAFVNTERVLRESALARAAQTRLAEEFAEREKKLNELANQLRVSAESLEREKSMISDAVRLTRARQITNLERDLQNRQAEFRESLNRRNNDELATAIKHANRAIRQLAEDNGIDLIFQKAVYASSASDITDAVISKMGDASSRMVVRGVAFHPQTIKFLSTERILRDSKAAKSAQLKLEAEFRGRELALSSGQNLPTFAEDQKRFRDDLNFRRNQELSLVVDAANREIRAIAEKMSINFVFQTAVYASPNVDMSAEVIAALDKAPVSLAHNANSSEQPGTSAATPSPVAQAPRQAEPPSSSLGLSVSPSQPDANGVVTFTITTNSDTASLKINGDEEGGRSDGRYSVHRFAQVGENRFEVVATDRLGNTQRQTVAVRRDVEEVAARIQPLNPTAIQEVRPRDAVAIIIGIEKYRSVGSAAFADKDARLFYDYARRALGVRPENIKLLLDEKADAAEILLTFRNWLPTRVKTNSTHVYVFYSGHGLPSEDGNSLYFLPHEARTDLLERTAISQNELVAAIQKSSPKSVTMFIDSCYSGQSRTGETLLASARPISVKAKQSSFPKNFTVISASAPDQYSFSSPELKHGIFSYYLMRGMEGEADGNKDGQITVAEMQSYLSEKVTRRAMGMNRTQQPQVVGDQSRVLVGR